jgi:WD40 repeat protein
MVHTMHICLTLFCLASLLLSVVHDDSAWSVAWSKNDNNDYIMTGSVDDTVKTWTLYGKIARAAAGFFLCFFWVVGSVGSVSVCVSVSMSVPAPVLCMCLYLLPKLLLSRIFSSLDRIWSSS